MNKHLSRLEKVDLRDIFELESDFAQWLAQKESMTY